MTSGGFIVIVVAFLLLCALSWDENYYFPSFLGRVLDLFFDRDPYDPFVPGSGFTLYIDDRWKTISNLSRFLSNLFWSLLLLISTPFIIFVAHVAHKTHAEARAFEERMSGAKVPEEETKPLVNNRYMTLGGDGKVIFVCGAFGGFEEVIDGDIEGAIVRRRERLGRREFF